MKRLLSALMFAMFLLAVPAASLADTKIDARCANAWAGDYRMQKHCRTQQEAGKADVDRFVTKYGLKTGSEDTPFAAMLRKCSLDWTDEYGPDWRMLAHCLSRQESAYRELQ